MEIKIGGRAGQKKLRRQTWLGIVLDFWSAAARRRFGCLDAASRLELTLHSEAEWEAARGPLAGPGGGAVERPAALFTICRQSLSGRMKGFAPAVRTRLRGGRNDGVNAWWNAVDGLEAVHLRSRDVKRCSTPRPWK
jgi:hypothetical protein